MFSLLFILKKKKKERRKKGNAVGPSAPLARGISDRAQPAACPAAQPAARPWLWILPGGLGHHFLLWQRELR